MKKTDFSILAALLLLGIILSIFIFRPENEEPGKLEVRQNGKVILTLSLSRDTVKTIKTETGSYNTFSIQHGTVSMTNADCGDHTCIETGTIRNAGETIVCLPHRLVLKITAEKENGPDAIVH